VFRGAPTAPNVELASASVARIVVEPLVIIRMRNLSSVNRCVTKDIVAARLGAAHHD
jgi:hypothetical protein